MADMGNCLEPSNEEPTQTRTMNVSLNEDYPQEPVITYTAARGANLKKASFGQDEEGRFTMVCSDGSTEYRHTSSNPISKDDLMLKGEPKEETYGNRVEVRLHRKKGAPSSVQELMFRRNKNQ